MCFVVSGVVTPLTGVHYFNNTLDVWSDVCISARVLPNALVRTQTAYVVFARVRTLMLSTYYCHPQQRALLNSANVK